MTAEQRPLLSICIPTFNRVTLLKEAIDSILQQADGVSANDVEIVVSDNASTDGTDAAVGLIKKTARLPITYFRNDKNVGFDGNCLRVVGRATGQYAWILGDDDLLASGALPSVLHEIKGPAKADVYFGEKDDFYLTPDRPMRIRRVMKQTKEQLFDFKQKDVQVDYFRANKKLIAYFNFISMIIFDRSKWLQVEGKNAYDGTGYIHVYVFQSMLWGRQKGVLKYLPAILVKRRWGADRVDNQEKRLRQDVTMFRRIAEAVFEDKRYVRLIDDLVLRNDGFSWAVRAKLHDPKRFIQVILPFLFRAYWDHPLFWFKIVPLVFLPNFLLRFGRGFYRKLIKGEPINIKEMMED